MTTERNLQLDEQFEDFGERSLSNRPAGIVLEDKGPVVAPEMRAKKRLL